METSHSSKPLITTYLRQNEKNAKDANAKHELGQFSSIFFVILQTFHYAIQAEETCKSNFLLSLVILNCELILWSSAKQR